MRFPKGTTEHPINKDGKCEYLVSIWDFGAVHPQSERQHYICNDHPAKMRPALAKAILELYGESPVLDPMAGIGTTLIEAMLLGMNTVGVEYERRFVRQANENIKHIQQVYRGKVGKALCIQGDARDLSCLNDSKVKSILTSPPYYDAVKSVSTGHQGPEGGHLERQHKLAKLKRSGYGNESNIGHIKNYGDDLFGSILFSPPYFDALSINKGGGSKTSILYEETTRELQMRRSGPFAVKKNLPTPYSSRHGNLGNVKDQSSYLNEMLKVYRECYRVLKPGKFMVVVVKDIQRNWKTIPIGADTIKLCQLAGFDCHDIIINKMYFPSFWILNLARKAQTEGRKEPYKLHVLKIHEYVLVLRKLL